MRVLLSALSVSLLSWGLTGCEQLGIPNLEKERAVKEAEGKAVGAACRHAGRAIEDCYTLNPKAMKSAVFIGWKEMNDYMTTNKIEVSVPKLTEQASEDKKKSGKGGIEFGGFPPPEPLIKPRAKEEATPKEPGADKTTQGTPEKAVSPTKPQKAAEAKN